MSTLLTLFRREFHRIAIDPLAWFCMFVGPLLTAVFFLSMMDEGAPRKIPVGIVDEDNTSISRLIVRNLDAFPELNVSNSYPTITLARQAVQRGEIYGFYYIPYGVTQQANAMKVPTISFYMNRSALMASSMVYKDMTMLSELISAAATRKVLYAKGASKEQALAFLQPIAVKSYATNNPSLNFNIYLSNMLISGIFGLFVMMFTVYSVGNEIKYRTGKEWLIKGRGSITQALIGKFLPHILIYMIVAAAYLLFLDGIGNFPFNGGLWRAYLMFMTYVLACMGLGTFFITLLPALRLGLSAASLWSMLSFSMAGFTFPFLALPQLIQAATGLFPLRHFYILYCNTTLNGFPLLNTAPSLYALLAFAMLPVFSAWRLKQVLLNVKYIP